MHLSLNARKHTSRHVHDPAVWSEWIVEDEKCLHADKEDSDQMARTG